MFVNQLVPFICSTLLATAGASAPTSEPEFSDPCAELARAREDVEAATARLADWMDRHCPGSLEVTEPFCQLQSQSLLEQLDGLGEVKSSFAANRCELSELSDLRGVGAQASASLIGLGRPTTNLLAAPMSEGRPSGIPGRL